MNDHIPILFMIVGVVSLIASIVSLWREYHTPRQRWQDWKEPRIIDTYSWITKVDTRPLEQGRDYGDEDRTDD